MLNIGFEMRQDYGGIGNSKTEQLVLGFDVV